MGKRFTCTNLCVKFIRQCLKLRKARAIQYAEGSAIPTFSKGVTETNPNKSRWSECESPNGNTKWKKSIALVREKDGFLDSRFEYCGEPGQ